MSLLQSGFGSSGDDYEITDSLRFRSASDAYLNRTFSTPTNNKKWSYSVWMKRGTLSTNQAIISSNVDGANYWDMRFNTSDQIFIQNRVSSSNLLVSNTTAVYRDSSAWYHITFVFDSDNSTASHRNRLYINGVEQTLSANSGSGDASYWNVNAVQHNIGVSRTLNSSGGIWAEYDGYQTEANFIDGQALDPTDFGEYDANGTWKPKEYTGTYGTNGFYLPMKPTTQAELQNTVIFSADGTGSSVSGFGFTPDFIWAKNRTNTYNHELWDTVRGTASDLASNSFAAEITDGNRLISFDSDGFSYGTGSNLYVNNTDSVAWGWDAGDNQPSTGHSSILYTAATADGTYDIKGFGFNPDLLWIKNRNNSERNFLFDTVRGVDSSKALVSDSTAAEGLNGINATTISTIEDGFRIVESSINSGELYFNNRTYVAWGWDAGDGDPVSNTTGDINSTVKANDATGFSIVSYTGNGTSNSEQTIGHGLSTAPKVVIVKDRTSASTRWSFYSTDLSSDGTYAVKNLLLNTTGAESAYSSQIRGIQGSNTFSVRDVDANGNANVNKSGDNYIAYCFSEVSGVSKFGTYTGNGSTTGPTITTGFRSGFVMIKSSTNSGTNWLILDSTRSPFNTVNDVLFADLTSAEAGTGYGDMDVSDTGFQIKTNGASSNANGQTYIYMAFKGSYSDHVSPLNDDGSIDSRVKANTSKGFSIVSYKGIGANATVGHGLSSAPEMVIVRARDNGGATQWAVWHSSFSSTEYALLQSTAAKSSSGGAALWNSTAPSSTVLSIGTDTNPNYNTKSIIAYCWHSVAGYSKIGSYTGTGTTTGNVTTLGFRPGFLMIKGTTGTSEWVILDNTRDPNPDPAKNVLHPNRTNADSTAAAGLYVKFTDTGFQPVGVGTDTNASGQTFLYMAFADTADAQFNFDASGNKNNWLPTNINSSGESETTYDLMKDTPSLVDENAGNFATLNPIDYGKSGTASTAEANLKWTDASGGSWVNGTIAVSSGKWYWETSDFTGTGLFIGVADATKSITSYIAYYSGAPTSLYYLSTGQKTISGSSSSFGAATTTSDLLGFALDADANTLAVYKNNVLLGTMTSLGYEKYLPIWSCAGAHNFNVNFGQRPFEYTPPTGFLKLNTFNLPDSTIEDGSDYFNTVLYNGNGNAQSIDAGLATSFVWIKNRIAGNYHYLYDQVRGAHKGLTTNTTAVEDGYAHQLTSFDSDGFTVPNDTAGYNNYSGRSYVAWNWKGSDAPSKTFVVTVTNPGSGNRYTLDGKVSGTNAMPITIEEGGTYTFDQSDNTNSGHPLRFSTTSDGTHGGGSEYTTGVTVSGTPGSAGAKTVITVAASAADLYFYCTNHSGMGAQASTLAAGGGVSNLSGTISSVVNVNTTAGFSIVRYQGTGSASTVGHGLSSAPEMIIVKDRDRTTEWSVMVQAANSGNGHLGWLRLNGTYAYGATSILWNNTAPTSSVFSIGTYDYVNYNNSNYIAYCFHSVEGYSAFGSYTGNGSADGPFVYLGFRPAFVITKRTNSTSNWPMHDNKRSPYNVTEASLYANAADAEVDPSTEDVDFLSNGFKLRGTTTARNTSGSTYIYMAFAENPFKNSNAR